MQIPAPLQVPVRAASIIWCRILTAPSAASRASQRVGEGEHDFFIEPAVAGHYQWFKTGEVGTAFRNAKRELERRAASEGWPVPPQLLRRRAPARSEPCATLGYSRLQQAARGSDTLRLVARKRLRARARLGRCALILDEAEASGSRGGESPESGGGSLASFLTDGSSGHSLVNWSSRESQEL